MKTVFLLTLYHLFIGKYLPFVQKWYLKLVDESFPLGLLGSPVIETRPSSEV